MNSRQDYLDEQQERAIASVNKLAHATRRVAKAQERVADMQEIQMLNALGLHSEATDAYNEYKTKPKKEAEQ